MKALFQYAITLSHPYKSCNQLKTASKFDADIPRSSEACSFFFLNISFNSIGVGHFDSGLLAKRFNYDLSMYD